MQFFIFLEFYHDLLILYMKNSVFREIYEMLLYLNEYFRNYGCKKGYCLKIEVIKLSVQNH